MFSTEQLHDLGVLAEASYDTPSGKVMFMGADTMRDLHDLYAVLDENHTTGSSNLENDQVRQMLTDVQQGKPLNDGQWGALQGLLGKYRSKLAALRSSPDHEGQDYLKVAPEGTGRLVR